MKDIKQIVESAVLENGLYVARTSSGIYKFPPEMRENILKRKPLIAKKDKYHPSKVFQDYLAFVDQNKDVIPFLILIKDLAEDNTDYSIEKVVQYLRKKQLFSNLITDRSNTALFDNKKRYEIRILINMLPIFPKAWFNQGE